MPWCRRSSRGVMVRSDAGGRNSGPRSCFPGPTRPPHTPGAVVATCLDPCGHVISAPVSRRPPRTPHQGKTAGSGGPSTGTGGRAIAFPDAGQWRHHEKPVDDPLCNLVSPRGCKRKPPTSNSQNTRVGAICPRVALFLPRVSFCSSAPRTPSLSLFSLEKEREKGGPAQERAIHGFLGCLKKHPRVCYEISSYSVDQKSQKVQCWRALASRHGLIHVSTGRNACTFPEAVRNE